MLQTANSTSKMLPILCMSGSCKVPCLTLIELYKSQLLIDRVCFGGRTEEGAEQDELWKMRI